MLETKQDIGPDTMCREKRLSKPWLPHVLCYSDVSDVPSIRLVASPQTNTPGPGSETIVHSHNVIIIIIKLYKGTYAGNYKGPENTSYSIVQLGNIATH